MKNRKPHDKLVNEDCQLTKFFIVRMLPLSLVVSIFICLVVPFSYYLIICRDLTRQAALHADYLSSIFRDTMENEPLEWEKKIKSHVMSTVGICSVCFFDRRHNSISEIVYDEDCHRFVTAERTALFAGKVYAFVKVNICLDKQFRYAVNLLTGSTISGAIIGLFLFLIPVRHIKRAEKRVENEKVKLKISEEKYRTLFELAPDGIAISTLEGKIISCNESFLKICGLTNTDQLENFNAKSLYIDPKEREEIMEELYSKGEVINREAVFKRSDGNIIPVLISMKLIGNHIIANENIDTENRIFETIIHDCSSIKKVEKQLMQAQKMESIGLLAGGVAHDFNNILSGIMGYASLIRMISKNKDIDKYAEIIEKAVVNAGNLTRKLLTFARSGQSSDEIMDLNQIVKETLLIIKRTFNKNITIVEEIQENLYLVKGDSSQIYQVLLNFCVNARDTMPEGGKLTIKTFNASLPKCFFPTGDISEPGNYAVVSITDTGEGIRPEMISRIFEPFFTTKEVGKGTGLGLSVIYGIVRNHNGYIDVESSVGTGSSFTVYLPSIKNSDETKSNDEEEEIVPGGKETILLIDDEEMVRAFSKKILESKGYNVLLAENGRQGIEIFKNTDKIHLVITDMIMPGISGMEVLKILQSIAPGIKIIIMSGYSLDKHICKLKDMGESVGFLQKPYSPSEILKMIRQVIEGES